MRLTPSRLSHHQDWLAQRYRDPKFLDESSRISGMMDPCAFAMKYASPADVEKSLAAYPQRRHPNTGCRASSCRVRCRTILIRRRAGARRIVGVLGVWPGGPPPTRAGRRATVDVLRSWTSRA
jgi:hypothetical protein